MSVENELTEEERAEFAEHGVTFAADDPLPAAAEPVAAEPLAAPAEPVPATIEAVRDPATGQFVAATPAEGGDPATPAVDPATGQPTAPVTPPPGFVPHAALHAERVKNAEIAKQLGTLKARTNAILINKTYQPAPMPDMVSDPEGYLHALEERQTAFEAERAQAQQFQEIDRALEQDETNFIVSNPDYPAASDYYVASRAKELLLSMAPADAQTAMVNEVRAIAAQAWQRGVPASEFIYEIAKARGYTPGQPTPTPAPVAVTPAPAAATPAPAAAPAAGAALIKPAAAVAAVKAGQAASKSLSGQGGHSVADLNAEALLSMSDDEFAAHLKLTERGANQRFLEVGGR